MFGEEGFGGGFGEVFLEVYLEVLSVVYGVDIGGIWEWDFWREFLVMEDVEWFEMIGFFMGKVVLKGYVICFGVVEIRKWRKEMILKWIGKLKEWYDLCLMIKDRWGVLVRVF